MRASIAIAALLGAGALAQPHLRNIHRHQKRDEVKEWNQNGVHYAEDIVDVYVTVGGGHAAPEASAAPSPIGQEKYVQNGGQSGGQRGRQQSQPAPSASAPVQKAPVIEYVQQQQPSAPAAAPSPAPMPIKQYQPQTQPQQEQQQQQPTQVAAPSPQQQPSAPAAAPAPAPSTNTQSSNPPSDGSYWTSSPLSPPNTPGAQDVLSRANYWRTKWNSQLGPFTWSSNLAKNSYTTTKTPTTYTTDPSTGKQVPHGEGGATVMGHMLGPGSYAQCIAGGGNSGMKGSLTPFDQAFLMWICEEPNGLAECSEIDESANGGDTGHAQIIKGSYNQIGCYWMGSDVYGGMWTCDFAGGADE